MGDERGGTVKTVLEIVGLLAGTLAFLYALGGGVLALRLFFEDLPSVTIVAQLPREFLVSLALTHVAVPAAAVAGLYLTFRLTGQRRPPRRLVGSTPYLYAAVGAVVTTAAGYSALTKNEPWDWALWWFAAAAFVVFAVYILALSLRARLARRFGGPAWQRNRPLTGMTLVVAFASLPLWVILGARFHLLDAKACMKGDFARTGVLVGETGERVYIGETGSAPRRVQSLPLAEVEELFIGGQATEQMCSFEEDD